MPVEVVGLEVEQHGDPAGELVDVLELERRELADDPLGALAGFAIMTKTELLLILIGGIFLIEALSVMLQVFTFKYWRRRIFLMAPILHHFEMKAWSETKIMVRFWIACAILCACAFALYYRFYFHFFRS